MSEQEYQTGFQSIDQSTLAFDGVPNGNSGDSILNIMWRYKWLLAVFIVSGLGAGYWMYQQKPTTYRASIQLQFKTDAPLTLDATTGAMVGGIPSGNLMQALITSDGIIARVVKDPGLVAVPALSGMSAPALASMIRRGVQFQTVTGSRDSNDRMIAAINFDGGDPDVCVAAVNAMNSAIGAHFEDEQQSTISEFSKIIETAQLRLGPEQKDLENDYKKFRQRATLEWDAKGQAVNPHRERQIEYQSQRQSVEGQMRELNSDLKHIKSVQDRNNDPLLVVQMIDNLSGVFNKLEAIQPIQGRQRVDMSDLIIKQLETEEQLVPLLVRRESLIADFGEGHPSVRTITQQIKSTREMLNDLDLQRTERMDELKKQLEKGETAEALLVKKRERAQAALDTHKRSLEERLVFLKGEYDELSKKIADEKNSADKLTQDEIEDASFRRQIERYHAIMVRLEQQLQSVDLADVNSGITVEPVLASGQAFITGPDLKRDLILYGMLGLAVSGLLAVLFEASAKMFRSAEEVARELRLPVLTHIPVDEGRLKQGKVAENDQLSKLDPKLSVIHRPYSAAAEAIRGVRTAILFDRRAYGSKVFQITSPLPGDGKSTVSANIACSLAQSGKRVLLIDLDLRSPRLSLRFNLDGVEGLTNVLNGEISPFEAVSQTPVENLDVLGCGPLPANPAEALTLAELGDVFDWARDQYDFVIVDTPPLLMVTDPSIVTTYVDAAILTMRVRRRCKPNAKEATTMLRAAGARVMGLVINKVDEMSSSYKTSASGSYQSIGYGYGDKYRRRYQKEAKSSDTYVVKGKSTEEGFSKPLVSGTRNGNGNGIAMAERDSNDRGGTDVAIVHSAEVPNHLLDD